MLNYHKLKTSLIHLTLFLSASLSLTLPSKVAAQVVINGRLIQGQELAALEYQAGTKLPPGNYQIEMSTGLMIYQGATGQAIINLYTGEFVSHGQNGLQSGNLNQGSGNSYNPSSKGSSYMGRDGNIYDPSTNSSAIHDSKEGCTYFTSGGFTINSCDPNW